MKLPKNEGKCLDAVLRVLELTDGAIRHELSSPEQIGEEHPVELTCKIGDRLYALEHTRVEAFRHQIGDGFKFALMTDPLVESVKSKLPEGGLFQLILEVGATKRLRKHEVPKIRANLEKWIVEAAHRLADNGDQGGVRDVPFGVPFAVHLNWQRWRAPTRMFAGRGVDPARIESNRQVQLLDAVRGKLSKLQGWAARGAVDVLILENWDSALSNLSVIAEALEAALPILEYVSSDVYCVDTCINSQWDVWALRRGGNALKPMPYWTFDPNDLRDPRVYRCA